ncbi:hypothetical protein SAMN05444172_2147 [Burkholderia sp. GAS332]|uniref:hypothetical protein n=1 Tax=Paraburkholderia sediminicola TaxID=458836 RepID=UPI0009277C64|nr:hypothetical protein SAMN05444172_2147 [Burkholderia sp. GAS332]
MCAICDLKIEFNIGHPLALSVAVATRAAIDSGTLPESLMDGALSNVKMRMAAIDALKGLTARLEASKSASELQALPDFYVLLIEIGTWGFFHATENGFDPDITPEAPDVTSDNQADRDIVFVTSETTLRAVLDRRLSIDTAFAGDLVMLDAGAEHTAQLRAVLNVALPAEGSDASVWDDVPMQKIA